jgi:hypothetical protein
MSSFFGPVHQIAASLIKWRLVRFHYQPQAIETAENQVSHKHVITKGSKTLVALSHKLG